MRTYDSKVVLGLLFLTSALSLAACSKNSSDEPTPSDPPPPETPGPVGPGPEEPGPEEPPNFCESADDGAPCEASVECAAEGACDNGVCPDGQIDCSLFDLACFGASCLEGECLIQALVGTSCDLADECTAESVCDSGVCTGGFEICDLGRDPQCIREVCVGESCTYTNVADGTKCALSPECTEEYSCQAGYCVPSTDEICTPDTALLSEYVGGAGGDYFAFDCPTNSVLVTLGSQFSDGWWHPALLNLSASCSALSIVDGEISIATSSTPIVTSTVGDYTLIGSGSTASCPNGSVITALSVAPEIIDGTDVITGMKGHCSSLSYVDSTIIPAAASEISPAISLGSPSYIQLACPEGSIGTGVSGRSGEVLDGIRLRCTALADFDL